MSNRIQPHGMRNGKGGVRRPAFEEDQQNKRNNAADLPKLQDVIDLQVSANAAKKDWKAYITRKRKSSLPSKRLTGIPTAAFQKHLSMADSELGLEMDSSLPKLDSFAKAKPTVGKHEQHKLNMKLIEHFVMLNNSPNDESEVDLEHLRHLLDRGANVNCHDKYGQTVLHEAARLWHTDVAVFLIDHGADVRKSDRYGRTPLHVAAATDYPEMVELLLERGAEIEAVTAGELQTPLHFASRNDAVEACKVLAKFGAQVEAEDYKKRTPVHVAAELDRSETARWLVENGANVGRSDDSGQSCMTHMITKMGPVARDALDTFHKTERANRRQYFYLNLLEHDISEDTPDGDKGGIDGTMAKTPLQVIVSYKQLDIIMHPVILKMLELKWMNFGRNGAIKLLLINLIYILLWSSLAVGVPWQTRYLYVLPSTDIWRIVVWILAVGMTVYFIGIEISEIITSRQRFRLWKHWRLRSMEEDMKFCHPKWPEERDYLVRETENLDKTLPAYFQDFWNFFDWTVYFLNFAVLVTHAVNIVAYNDENRPAPCCTAGNCTLTAELIRSGNVTARGSCALPNSSVNNACLSVWVNRIFVINIIMMWLKLMKNIRSFRTLGPFVVMLGKIFYDILRFLFLYFEFYIPYACAFWMIFGGEPSIETMSTVDQMLFSLYRITLVDEYQYDQMQAFDVVMTYFLVGTFLGISAILCINLFIALLSDTFQRVYDNANANAVMQQAIQVLSIEENLNPRQKQNFRRFIDKKCSPREEFYDDDLTTSEGDSLKKATLQIRDQMDEIIDYIRTEQREKKDMQEDLMHHAAFSTKAPSHSHLSQTKKPEKEDYTGASTQNFFGSPDNRLPPVARSGMVQLSSSLVTMSREVNKHQRSNERILKKMDRDIKEIKSLLAELLPGYAPRFSRRYQNLAQRSSRNDPASMFEPATFPLDVRELMPSQGSYLNENFLRSLIQSPEDVDHPAIYVTSSHRGGQEFLELTELPGSSDSSRRTPQQAASPEEDKQLGSVVVQRSESDFRPPNV